jgi:diaminopimelate epimerase
MQQKVIQFTKMHGAGNDFVMIDDRGGQTPTDRGGQTPTDRAFLAALAARRTGVGCEGVILVQKSETDDFKMRFFNPDGGEAELCGNGARCVAAFALAIGAAKGPKMTFETLAGRVAAEVLDEKTVRVRMPDPKDLRNDFANSGVPHKIVPVADLAATDVDGEGRRIRYASEFAPAGTNVDFVAYAPPHDAALRTYERGVEAESGACGTGAVATAVVGVAQHGMSFPVRVKTSSGYTLVIDGRRKPDGNFTDVTLTGPVAVVFMGQFMV